jgi:hypothetical protein
MTEAEWELCRDVSKMVRAVDPRRFDRKLRLFAVACCRRVSAQIRDSDALCLLDLIEKLADGAADLESLRPVWAEVPFYPRAEGAVKHATALDCASWRASADCYLRAAKDAEEATADAISGDGKTAAQQRFEQMYRERSVQVAILRDIFGNPIRPIALNPSWLTSTAHALARQMYDSRDFSAMPILADALQDAGCDNEDILNHCRGEDVHVRGCWVVDLLTGRN